ncbi:putative ribonuclease H-like domain-containing protein [Tanacetum coccineum]
MSGSQDEIPPPPPPPPSSPQTPTQQTPHTVSTIKLPILKKGEYDIWAMKMEHYLAYTDYPIWEVIQNGNGPNNDVIEFCQSKRIKKEYNNAKTPQQNGVVERKNMTLIEAARTMLVDSFLPNTFWAEAVSTACYVLNRVLVTKPYNKTPYELLTGKIPIISYIRPFGCHVTILNTIDHLGKFAGKSDEGFLVGMRDAWNFGNKDGSRTGKKEDSKALVTIDGEGVDWTNHSEEDEDYALMACNNSESDTEVWSDAPIIEEYESDSEDEYVSIQTKEQETPSFATSNLNHLIRDCDFHKKRMARKAELNHGWNNVQRVNKQNQFVPAAVLTRTGKIPVNTARASETIEEGKPCKRYRNKKDERGVVDRNKARLVAQGHRQEEGIDYDEVFAPVARIKAIRIFLAFASYMGFLDPKYPQKVYKVVKALYGLHQAPRAWYATLSAFLLKNGYKRGTIDKTLFLKKDKKDIILVQVYVDDIIFGSTKKSWCDEFEALMKSRFQMSSMGELTFFLRLLVKQKEDGIFISQDKYVAEILKKFDFASVKTASTPIETQKPLVKDEEASDVDVHLYRSMIGSLMYLTASRPGIMFAVCACSRFQVTPKTSHLSAVKRIFRYLKGKPKLGLWYPKVSTFDLESYSDSDYAGANLDRKSTTGGCQFLGRRLISWQCKKQTIVATSTTEAEYVAAASCCGQVLWIQNQMLDYGFNFMNTKIYIDNESTICIVKNPVYHSKTKHIAIRHHFIRDAYEKKLIQVLKIHTDDNVADLLTKAFDVSRFQFLVVTIGMKGKHFSGKVTPLFATMLVQPTQDEGANSERPSEAQPSPSPAPTSEVPNEPQTDSSPTQTSEVPSKSTSWDQIPTNIATAVICLTSNQKYNFSKLIFDGKVTPLFASMLVQPTEDEGAPSERPSEAQPTPSPAHTSEVPFEPQTDSSPAHISEVPIEPQTDPSPRPSPSLNSTYFYGLGPFIIY